ncbi:MAG: trehalose-phosphatase [Syntrophaceae bacterium]
MPADDVRSTLRIINIPDFWARLGSSPTAFLALDYDGTLAPFKAERMQAMPFEGIAPLLRQIVTKSPGTVAIISGRPIFEIELLLPEQNLILIGNHGFEIKRPGLTIQYHQPNPGQAQGLAAAQGITVNEGAAHLLEIKMASLALHTRGLAPATAAAWEDRIAALWTEIAGKHALEVRRFNGGIELRCRGRSKGDAVQDLITSLGHEPFFVFIGDDDTDEDVFRAISNHGIGIKVDSMGTPTAAHGYVSGIEEVRVFLACWLRYAPRSLS